MDSYARATGSKINYIKYQLMSINLADDKVAQLANVLGYQVGTTSFTYIVLPMGTTRPTVRDFMPLVVCIERRLMRGGSS